MNEDCNINTQGDVTLRIDGKIIAKQTNRVVPEAADILARLLGSDANYTISHIGFIYDSTAPDNTEGANTTWADFAGCNMIITPITGVPTYTSTDAKYEANKVTLLGFSDSGAAPTLGEGSPVGHSYTHLVLLATYYKPGSITPTYKVFSYIELADEVAVVEGKELNVAWALTNTK